jgi:hypothetical protein
LNNAKVAKLFFLAALITYSCCLLVLVNLRELAVSIENTGRGNIFIKAIIAIGSIHYYWIAISVSLFSAIEIALKKIKIRVITYGCIILTSVLLLLCSFLAIGWAVRTQLPPLDTGCSSETNVENNKKIGG